MHYVWLPDSIKMIKDFITFALAMFHCAKKTNDYYVSNIVMEVRVYFLGGHVHVLSHRGMSLLYLKNQTNDENITKPQTPVMMSTHLNAPG